MHNPIRRKRNTLFRGNGRAVEPNTRKIPKKSSNFGSHVRIYQLTPAD